VASTDGRITLAVNSQTPLRIMVPAGEYSLVIFGPRGQEQTPTIAATADKPGNCMAVFAAVDVRQIIKTSSGKMATDGNDASMLAAGLEAFYGGDLALAEQRLQQHLAGTAPKRSLAEFYLGASELTQFYLAGEGDDDPNLQSAAQQAFRLAKQEPDFVPPEQYVSPKIVAAYENTRTRDKN
jgi:hypothetical protein